jgi:glycosyltransferase involved in cell wall biosynthesis
MEKLIVVTFAGRKKYMEILFPYIEKYKQHITEYHLYLATKNEEDIQYMVDFYNKNQDFVKIIRLENQENFNKALVWNLAYKNCQEEDTIYLKIDDDVVYVDDNLFTNFIDFRRASDAPLVYPHIINNIISSPLLQKKGILELPTNWDYNSMVVNTWKNTIDRIEGTIKSLRGVFPSDYVVTNVLDQKEILCPVSWGNPHYSRECHLSFLEVLKSKGINSLYTEDIVLSNYDPMSIQCCSWIGRDLKKYTTNFGDVGSEDEPWMSVYLPLWLENPNVIFGKSVVSHFSSYNQENFLIESGILEEYKSSSLSSPIK